KYFRSRFVNCFVGVFFRFHYLSFLFEYSKLILFYSFSKHRFRRYLWSSYSFTKSDGSRKNMSFIPQVFLNERMKCFCPAFNNNRLDFSLIQNSANLFREWDVKIYMLIDYISSAP